MVEIARRTRTPWQAQGVAATQRTKATAILGNIRVSKQIDLGHRRLLMPVLDSGAIIALHFQDR
jgi:hypothetical protein